MRQMPLSNSNITLSDMVSLHEKYMDATPYKNIFGDGFLYKRNLFYRNIRNVGKKFKIQFMKKLIIIGFVLLFLFVAKTYYHKSKE